VFKYLQAELQEQLATFNFLLQNKLPALNAALVHSDVAPISGSN
jgi:Ser/Thr protein kinase RdoA (MazF antagonist)